jgi:hypothetical protein
MFVVVERHLITLLVGLKEEVRELRREVQSVSRMQQSVLKLLGHTPQSVQLPADVTLPLVSEADLSALDDRLLDSDFRALLVMLCQH